ncbi:hypothetical protein [Bradyrhizobium sp. CCBAU 51753]|uniref:hypothetical protein n=1 Tax=Bradyrhizobium sp. CCBAU 51753 TaxID=1325100 RepID=UPI00188CF325|nr:hypothetical protein [Bradyrhizobium sp. CCBAU 51753]QOZ29240.1 hypothetical protein XH93_41095 [Bradyrhizobium sp. CCBAU 51753]
MRNSLRPAQDPDHADQAENHSSPSDHLTSVAEDQVGRQRERSDRPLTPEQLSSARRLRDIMSNMEAELKEQVDKLVATRN